MKKKSFLYVALIGVLFVLMGVKFHQMSRPLFPDIVSLDDNKRNMAVTRLGKLSPEKKVELREKIIEALADGDPRVRRYALYAVRKINLADDKTVEVVARSFQDEDPSVREEAIGALLDTGQLGTGAGVKLLANARGVVTDAAATYFERLGPEYVPDLMAVFTLPGTLEGRRAAALTLVKMGSPTPPVVEVFEDVLKKGYDPDVVKALVHIGPAAKSTAPLLRSFLSAGQDSLINDDAPRPLSARALGAVDPRSTTLNNLSWDLKHKDPLIRYRAIIEWGRKKDLDVGAIPAMVNALSDKDPYVAARAAEILVRLDLKNVEPLSKSALPALKDVRRRITEETVEGFGERVGTKIDALFQGRRG